MDLGIALHTDELCEGFVQPETIPPLHSDEIAKPHVRDLVQEYVASLADVEDIIDTGR